MCFTKNVMRTKKCSPLARAKRSVLLVLSVAKRSLLYKCGDYPKYNFHFVHVINLTIFEEYEFQTRFSYMHSNFIIKLIQNSAAVKHNWRRCVRFPKVVTVVAYSWCYVENSFKESRLCSNYSTYL